MTSGRLAGKVCVVTGTGGSMGRATAVTFAREGASVVGCDVVVEPAEATVQMAREAGGEMVSLQPCRLSDPVPALRRAGRDRADRPGERAGDRRSHPFGPSRH